MNPKFIEHFNIYPKAEIIVERQYSEFDLVAKKGFKKYIQLIKHYLLGTITDEYEPPGLTPYELFLILIRLNLNHVVILGYLNLCFQYGGLLVFFVYTILSILISPGLCNLYVSIGAYSKRSFMNVWEMVPLFGGFQFISIVNILLRMTKEVIVGGLYLRMMFYSIADIPWDMCNDLSCKWEPNKQCTIKKTFEIDKVMPFGLFKYIDEVILKTSEKDTTVWEWSIHVMMFGLICTSVLLMRFKRYKILVIKIFPWYIIINGIFIISILLLYYGNPIATMIRTELEDISNVLIWLRIMSIVMQEELPSHWVTVGCFGKSAAALDHYVWFIHAFNIMVKLLFLLLTPLILGAIQIIYDVKDHHCIYFSGLHTFITAIPQALYFVTGNRGLVVAYFMSLSFWCLNVIILNLDLLQMAILHTYTKLYRFRNLILIILMMIVTMVGVIAAKQNVVRVNGKLNTDLMFVTKQLTFLFVIIIIVTYTLRRLNGDHYFIYGVEYNHMTRLKIMVLTVSLAFIMFMIELVKQLQHGENHIYKLGGLLLFSPIFFVMFHNLLLRKKQKRALLQPLSNWGPPDEEQRAARRLMNVNTMFIYRTRIACRHNCLLDTDLSLTLMVDSFVGKSVSSQSTPALLQKGRRRTLSSGSFALH